MKAMTPQQKRHWLFCTHLPEALTPTPALPLLRQAAEQAVPVRGKRWTRQTVQKMLRQSDQKPGR